MTTTDKHPARIYLDLPLMEWLRAEAARRHSSLSQIVRDLIVDRQASEAAATSAPVETP
jgi:hypothetical protein